MRLHPADGDGSRGRPDATDERLSLRTALNVEDLREAARRRLPRGIFEYIDRGTEDETLLAANRRAFERLRFAPAVLKDVGQRSTEAMLLGAPAAMPVAVAPMSPAGMVRHEGELALARAAASAGIPYVLPTESMTPLESIAEVGGRRWFQLYLWRDRNAAEALVRRAAGLGFEALLLTVDTPVSGNREFNTRNGFAMPFRLNATAAWDMLLHPRWLLGVVGRYALRGGLPQAVNHPPAYRRRLTQAPPDDRAGLDPAMSWEDLAWLRRLWPGRLLVKGVLRADDAHRAVECGADGVVVSNHGGRNFDSAMPSLEALPAVLDAIGGRASVLLDSGVRRGSDVAKALALGAEGVLFGRPMLWGLAAGGKAGAGRALALLRDELLTTLAFLGCRDPSELGPELLATASRPD